MVQLHARASEVEEERQGELTVQPLNTGTLWDTRVPAHTTRLSIALIVLRVISLCFVH